MNTQEILNEIYSLDESMKEYEKDLEKIINEFIVSRPDVKIDQDFVVALKKRLVGQELNEKSKKISIFTLPRLAFSLTGAALMFVLMIPFLNFDTGFEKLAMTTNDKASNTDKNIDRQKKQAFGSLSWNSNAERDGFLAKEENLSTKKPSEIVEQSESSSEDLALESDDMTDEQVVGGGGGFGSAEIATEPMAKSSRMIAPSYENFVYKYTGDKLELEQEEAAVYKLLKNKLGGFSGLVNFENGLIDISSLKSTEVNSFHVSEDDKFGYSVYFSASEGTVSINKNWKQWPRPDDTCESEACFLENRLKITDIVSFDKYIQVADDFLEEFSISKAYYGEAQVIDDFVKQYEEAEDKSNVWIPEDIQVIYPLELEGQVVYDEAGRVRGLSVSVDVRNMKASGAHSIRVNDFASSMYEMERDFSKLVQIAEKRNSRFFFREGQESLDGLKTIELGSPEEVLMVYWNYNNNKYESEELYVPALRFPVKNKPVNSGFYGGEYVVLPLAKEMLKDYERQIDPGTMPEPAPMPLEPLPMIDEMHILEGDGEEEMSGLKLVE